jgi:host factor-I protein
MSEKIINVQDALLNYVRKNKIPVTIFLMNGVKITGLVSCFDQCSVIVKKEGYIQMLYKHAISTFSPHGAVNIFDWNAQQGGGGSSGGSGYRQSTRSRQHYRDEGGESEDEPDEDYDDEFEEFEIDEEEDKDDRDDREKYP